jgi:hypothetical protein
MAVWLSGCYALEFKFLQSEKEKMRRAFALSAALMFGLAAAQPLGEWIYQTKGQFYAATINDSGHVFGQWCDVEDQSCIYLLAMSTSCEQDYRYPVLVNSDAGSLSTTVVCRGRLDSGKYRYVLSNFEDIDGLVKKAKRIGLAIPLEGDQFRVLRFSLDGATVALTVMRGAAEKAAPEKPAKNTRDQKL